MTDSLAKMAEFVDRREGSVVQWLVLVCCILVMQSLSACGQAQPQGTHIVLSSQNVLELVDGHNLFRGMVDPQASNMQSVVSSYVATSL